LIGDVRLVFNLTTIDFEANPQEEGRMMRLGRFKKITCWVSLAAVLSSGCNIQRPFSLRDRWQSTPSHFKTVATEIEYPNVNSVLKPEVALVAEPFRLENPADLPSQELLLADAINLAMSNGDILRSLNANVVLNPLGVGTKFNPAIAETNPNTGVEGALSAFDAQVVARLFWNHDNRPNNVDPTNPIIQQFQRVAFVNEGANFNYEINKRTATGASFAARHQIGYSLPNTPNLFYPSSYTGFVEAEYRQPLMKGSGVQYNRIAGTSGVNGVYNGVLIARINTDISLADFEAGVINYINDVESAYWELFFAYHNLESLAAGRNSALLTWQRVKELEKAGARGGDAAAEAQARSQYFSFEVQVKEALTGTRGLYASEQNLRYLLGMPSNDGKLLKPVSQPMEGQVVYDWQSAMNDALTSRVEIRRQKWNVKRRELEMIAARLNRRPQLDLVSSARLRGLGDNLIDGYSSVSSASLYQDIFSANFHEWQAGLEWSRPIGLRQAGAAVSNAQFNLARERALLEESELRISHDLSIASRSVARAFALMEGNYNRQLSDRQQVTALQARYEGGLDNINFLLQAQQQLATSQSAYFRSLVDYQLALRDFNREKGSLLSYNQVAMSEGGWAQDAYQDAEERGRFFAPRTRGSVSTPSPIASGSFDPSSIGQ
jgi:outer membrane protein TolC